MAVTMTMSFEEPATDVASMTIQLYSTSSSTTTSGAGVSIQEVESTPQSPVSIAED